MRKLMRRSIFTCVFGFLYLATCLPPATAQEKTLEKVVALDVTRLVRKVFPQATLSSQAPSLVGGRVSRRFIDPELSQGFDFQFSIHPDVEGALAGIGRTTPQAISQSISTGEVTGFISRRSCHLRLKNVVVLLQFDILKWPDPLLEEQCDALSAALADPEVVQNGERVNTPRVRVLSLKGSEGYLSEVLFTFSVADDVLVDLSGFPPAKRLPNSTYQSRVIKFLMDPEPILYVIRPSGEVAEVSVTEARKTVPMSPLVEKSVVPVMTEAAKVSIIDTIRADRLEPQEQIRLLLRLCELRSPDLVPFFRELIESDREGPYKSTALQGLADILKEAGIEFYRRYAADRGQDGTLRHDAVRLVGTYGEEKDVALLEEILAEGDEDFAEWIEYAINNLKGELSPDEE